MSEENTVAPLRRTNLLAWMEKNNLSKSDLAGRLGVGRAYVSLIFRPDRFFGERAARSMELKLNMPTGYLDSDQSKPMAVEEWSTPTDLPADVFALVPRVAVALAAGNGTVVDIPQDLPPLAFRRDWLQRQLVTARNNLRTMEVKGDSMEPYLLDGDTVLIDMGQQDIKDSEVYALRYGSELRVKRLSRRFDGGLLIRSDNPKYADEVLTAADLEHTSVLGRLLWRGG